MFRRIPLLTWLLLIILLAACTPGGGQAGNAPVQSADTVSPHASPLRHSVATATTPEPYGGTPVAATTLAIESTPETLPATTPEASQTTSPAPLASASANPSVSAAGGGAALAKGATAGPAAGTAAATAALSGDKLATTPAAKAGSAPLATQPAGSAAQGASSAGPVPHFNHIFLVVMENKEASAVVGNSAAAFINRLAGQYGRAANYYGVSHPSLPNYLALTGGDTFGITSDCVDCTVNASNLIDQLEQAGRSWKAYMESMPEACSRAHSAGEYAQKHNPFIYYDDIRTNPQRCNNVVPLSELQTDLQNNQVPDFVWISPDMCHDMHDCSVEAGDAWLEGLATQIMGSPAWKDNGVLFVTFDEGASTAGCCQDARGGRVDTVVASPLSRNAFVSQTPYSHYALLRTIEDAWGLPPLRKAGGSAVKPMADFFRQP